MSRPCLKSRWVLVTLLWLSSGMAAWAADDLKPNARPADLFALDKVATIHLEVSPAEYEAMQPTIEGFGGPGFGGPAQPRTQPTGGKKRETEKNLFGTDFPWVEASVTINGTSLKKVGLRYAGDITYFVSARGIKRPLKIAFDKFSEQKLNGLRAVQLHSMPLDPAKAREAIAASVFQAVGVGGPRAGFAEVTLTVPGKLDHELVGLFTVVENIDTSFLAERFGNDSGLLMKPFRVRGIDFLGDNWDQYKGQYQPQRDATPDEAKRVIEFAKFVNQASDDDFKQQIDSFIDVDSFLRFMAANALTANLESFFALGHNYTLYLEPKQNKFRFIPGDLEFSFANFLLMGTPDQLMDLSLTKPYPGENKLPDRLLAIKEIKDRYLALLQDLSQSAFSKDQLLNVIDGIEQTTRASLEKETKAFAARNEPAAGFGGPGGQGPQPPSLATFAQKRVASIADQLSGKSKGYAPQQLNFGPPQGGGNNNQAINETTFRESVSVPPEFDVTLYATPPQVNYPVAIAAEPTGVIYVAVDEQGSLGRTPGGGKILRCTDENGDGKVDKVTTYAKVEHPRGVVYRNGTIWVMHPPTLSVFQDRDGDGVAEYNEELVTGLTTDQITNRGGDHTTNCVRMGIDGWLYIGVGDYGIKEAVGKDGRKIVLRGGGIVRVRPDGTELEIYCVGLRNPFDLAIDPSMNLFTRDNTNDGAGWDTRVSLLFQTGIYGYTQLFANFTDEIMPTLGTFGGGGGTGSLFIQDSRWPQRFNNILFTGDWGRSEVYRHELTKAGPTFNLTQEVFMKMPRATGMDIDANGHLYVASWRGGESAVFVGPNVGFVARVSPKELPAEPFPNLKTAKPKRLVSLLASPQSVVRMHVQGEILSRPRAAETSYLLASLAADSTAPIEGRAAAIFTLKQLDGPESHTQLFKLASLDAVREFALRALTDRVTQLEGMSSQKFVAALSDPSPRIRAQALISLNRLQDTSVARDLFPLTRRPNGSQMPSAKPVQNQPDPDRVIPHLAIRTIVSLRAIDACLEALDGPDSAAALWALRYMHNQQAVEGLIKKLATVRTAELRQGILGTLIRLYYREADYTGTWWGIRPDNTGPYYDRAEWQMTARIGAVVTAAALDGDKDTVAFLKSELARHQVSLAGIPASREVAAVEKQNPITLPQRDPNNPDQLGNMAYEAAARGTLSAQGDAGRGGALFKSQSCIACHTTADGQTPKGPHLVDIGKRYKAEELVESVLKPSVKLAQGYETYQFETTSGLVYQGFVVSERADATVFREPNGVQRELKRNEIEAKHQQKQSAMPEGLVANLTAEQFADLIVYLQSLKSQ